MELTEATALLEWLQQERIKDKARLDALEAALEVQAAKIAEQSLSLQAWEGTRASVKAELLKLPALEAAQARWRDELLHRLDEDHAAQDSAVEDVSARQQQDHDTYVQTLGEMRLRLEQLERRAQEQGEQVGTWARTGENQVQQLAQAREELLSLTARAKAMDDRLAAALQAHERLSMTVAQLADQVGPLTKSARAAEDRLQSLTQAQESGNKHIAQMGETIEALVRHKAAVDEQVGLLNTRQGEALEHITLQRQRLADLEESSQQAASRLTLLAEGQDDIAAHVAEQRRTVDALAQEIREFPDKVAFVLEAHDQLVKRLAAQHDEVDALDQLSQGLRQSLDSMTISFGELAGRLSTQEEAMRKAQARDAELAEQIALLAQREDHEGAQLAMQKKELQELRRWTEEQIQPLGPINDRQDALLARLTELAARQDALENDDKDVTRRLTIVDQQHQETRTQFTLLDKAVQEIRRQAAALAEDLQISVSDIRQDRDQAARLQAQVGRVAADLKALTDLGQVNDEGITRLSGAISGLQAKADELARQAKQQAEKLETLSAVHPPILAQVAVLQERQATQSKEVRDQSALLARWEEQYRGDISNLQLAADSLKKEQVKLAEQLHVEQQEHRQRLDLWAKELGQWQKEVVGWAALLKLFDEQNKEAQKTLLWVRDTEKRLRQENDERKEMQRLGDERREKELRTFQGELEKQWTNFLTEQQWRRTKQEELDGQQDERLGALEDWRQVCLAELASIWDRIASNHRAQEAAVSEVWQATLAWMQQGSAGLQSLAAEIQKRQSAGGQEG